MQGSTYKIRRSGWVNGRIRLFSGQFINVKRYFNAGDVVWGFSAPGTGGFSGGLPEQIIGIGGSPVIAPQPGDIIVHKFDGVFDMNGNAVDSSGLGKPEFFIPKSNYTPFIREKKPFRNATGDKMENNNLNYIPYGAAALGAVLGNVLYKKYPKFGTAGRLLAIGIGAVSGYYISDKIIGGGEGDDFSNAVGGGVCSGSGAGCKRLCAPNYDGVCEGGSCWCMVKSRSNSR